jgi:hypothetical protein
VTFPSKRSCIGINSAFDRGMLIDQFYGSSGLTYQDGSEIAEGYRWHPGVMDAVTGLPNHADSRDMGLGGFNLSLPASSDFAGPYVLTWDGSAAIYFFAGTWTVNTELSSNYTEILNGRYSGTNSRIVLTYSGADAVIQGRCIEVDLGGVGAYPTKLSFYRLEDEARLLAGKVFRAPHLQHYVDLNPGVIRLGLSWGMINNSLQVRYRHRNKPEQQNIGGRNLLIADTFGDTTGTNQYAIANSATSPVAMEHGEVVQCIVTNGMVRGGAVTVTGITKANPGVVTYSGTNHPVNGDKIIFSTIAGMTELRHATTLAPHVYTVANVDTGAKTFELSGTDTSAFSNFTSGTYNQYITLNRGGLGDYPVLFPDGFTIASNYGNTPYLPTLSHKYFVFHKNLKGSSAIDGAWVFTEGGGSDYQHAIPAEIMTKFFVELDEMQVAQSTAAMPLGPTNMWINSPHAGLCSMDADYDADDHFAIGMINVILNGNGTWPALPARCSLLHEHSNEDWNFSGQFFSQTGYQARQGFLRYGVYDSASYSTLRKVVLVNDIKAAFPAETASGRIRFVLAGQGVLGVSGGNSDRIYGNTHYDNDVLNIWGGDPIDHFDAFAWAHYGNASSEAYRDANRPRLVSEYLAATTPAEIEAVCQEWVTDGVIGSAGPEGILTYAYTRLPEYAAAMAAKGKVTIGYEGGGGHDLTGSADTDDFLTAVKASRAWARVWQRFLRAWIAQSDYPAVATSAFYPTDLGLSSEAYGHIGFSDDNFYLNGIEGGALDEAYHITCLYNKSRISFGLGSV